MGNLEKLLVVGVLVVVIAILAVSLFWTNDVARIPDFEGTDESALSMSESERNSTGKKDEGAVSLSALNNHVKEQGKSGTNEWNGDRFPPVVGETPAVDLEAEPLFPGAAGQQFVSYKVKSGDTLEMIALRELGSRNLVFEILKANEGLDPRRLVVGATLLLPAELKDSPEVGKTESKAAEAGFSVPINEEKSSSPSTYTVKSGDTLWKIAKQVYGDGSKWKKILEANRQALPDPDKLRVGMKLQVP